jgi:hypothetical protein
MPSTRPSLLTPKTILPIVLALLALGIWLAHTHASFDVHSLLHQLRSVSVGFILIALRKTTALEMLPSQLIGFTIVGLFGRFADLARPYMIARRLKTSVATQLAVYSIERAFDLAAAAILFSVTLAFAPRNMPHHEAFARAGALSLAATALLVALCRRASCGACYDDAHAAVEAICTGFRCAHS